MASTQFSGKHEFYPARGAGALGADRKAVTALVFQAVIAGVGSTVAIQGDTGVVIAIQATALNTDQVIINAAIVYVNGLGGGSVFVEQSTYTLGANVALLASVFLYGAGVDTVLTIPAATDDCLEVNGATGWKIAYLTLRTTGVGANDAITLVNADDGEIFSVVIDDSGQDGIIIDAASIDVSIHDNKISNCTRFGINNSGDDNHIVDNKIDTTGNDGMFLQVNGTNNVVTNNRVSGWVGEGIDNDEPTNQVSHNNTQV